VGSTLKNTPGHSKGKLGRAESSATAEARMASTAADLKLWHHRMCHLGEDNLKLLQRQSLVRGLPEGELAGSVKHTCNGCLKGKMHRTPFPASEKKREREVLELVHTDLCGPMEATVGGSRYFLTFLDDCSKRSWVYLITHKNEVFEEIRNFKKMVEKQSGKKIKIFRTDNGGEYVSRETEEFFKEKGIEHQTTVPYTPQQNGAAERLNRTLMEKVRSMLA